MNKIAIFLGIFLFASFAIGSITGVPKEPSLSTSLENQIDNIDGFYYVEGKEGEKPYEGFSQIIKRGNVYVVSWWLGGETFYGIGIRKGDHLAVSSKVTQKDKELLCVNLYVISKGPILTGITASIPGNAKLNTEKMTFNRTPQKEEINEDN